MTTELTRSDAYLSEDKVYRYWLLRRWDDTMPMIAIIGVNPSTADENKDDQTIRKDIGFCKRLGFGGFVKFNLAAFRARDPKVCRAAYNPIGFWNTAQQLHYWATQFKVVMVVAAWGANGKYFPEQCLAIEAEFPKLWCWGKTADGLPRHPLMLPYSTPIELFKGSRLS